VCLLGTYRLRIDVDTGLDDNHIHGLMRSLHGNVSLQSLVRAAT
jgi:hypothetical protein